MTVQPQDLVLLGLLAKRPLHGYEIKQTLESVMSEVVRVSPGTIYYTLKKLERRRLITSSSARAGNRPERRVYAVTAAGRAELKRVLSASLVVDERPYYLFDAALYFFEHLDRAELERAIALKLERIARFKEMVTALERANPGAWPLHLDALRRKGRLLADASETWYRELAASLAAEATSPDPNLVDSSDAPRAPRTNT